MKLVIDIGNTCAKLVCFDGDSVIEELRMDKHEDGVLRGFCDKYDFSCGIWSAVSKPGQVIDEAIASLPFPMLKLVSGQTPIPIINKYSTPHTLGSDRLAAAVGASVVRPGRDVLVVDIGTCVTFDFVSSRGEYLGGNISPGPTMRLKALNQYTCLLPLVERKGYMPLMGADTETAIRSGVIHGIRYEIEGYVRHLMSVYPSLLVYLTGGVHLNLQFSENLPIFADDFIVPKGLNRILDYNNGI